MKIKQPELRKPRIVIIPMVDTIFFLLVFFMITWLTMVKINGMPLTLPKPSVPGQNSPPSIVLSVSSSGRYYLNSRGVNEAGWKDGLQRKLTASPGSTVVINVSPSQKTQTLVSIVDGVNQIITSTHSHAQVLVATERLKFPAAEHKNGTN